MEISLLQSNGKGSLRAGLGLIAFCQTRRAKRVLSVRAQAYGPVCTNRLVFIPFPFPNPFFFFPSLFLVKPWVDLAS